MNIDAPVLLIFFNREDELLKVIQAIKKCSPKKMYIASDGGRTKIEHERIVQLRQKIKTYIDWDCQLNCLFSDKNLGCEWGPISAINWVFENEDQCIIIEDDCIPDISFFTYCDELLKKYAKNENVWMISGDNYLADNTMFGQADYTFSLRTDTWGWATWKRAWEKCDFRLQKWPIYKREKVLAHTYYMRRYDELDYMTKQLDNIYKKKDKSIWDYQWRFHMIINNGLCIVPRNNLVNNIGWGKCATHTKKDENKIWNVPIKSLHTHLCHPSCITANADFDKKYGELLFKDKLLSQIKNKNIFEAIKMLLRFYLKK